MSISTFPEQGNFVGTVGIYLSSGTTGTPAEGWTGFDITVNKQLARGIYTGGGNNSYVTVNSTTQPASSFVITTAVSSLVYKVRGSWNSTALNTIPSTFSGLVGAGGRFVGRTITTTNGMWVSTNGVNWTTLGSAPTENVVSGSNYYVNRLTFANNLYITPQYGTVNGQIASSTDGITWTTRLVITSTLQWNAVAYGANYYVTWSTATTPTVAISTNLTTWATQAYNGIASLTNLSFVGNVFAAGGATAGHVVISSNGTTWATRNTGTGQAVYSVAFGNNTYVAVGVAQTIAISTDLTTWTLKTPTVLNSTPTLSSITYANGYFVTAGDSINVGGQFSSGVFSSTDGNVWTSRYSLGNYVVFSSNIYVTAGNNAGTAIYYAPNVAGYAETGGTVIQGYAMDYYA